MKKTFKRLGAMFLAMAMAVSVLCTGAMAADETNYTITINGKTTGHTYEAYQVFSGTVNKVSTVLSDIQWGSSITDGSAFLTALKAADTTKYDTIATDFASCNSAADVAGVLTGNGYAGTDAEKTKKFAAFVGDYLIKNNVSAVATSTEGDSNIYTISVTNAGYYFIKDDDSVQNPNSATRYILNVVGPTTVTTKDGTVPTVEKKVNNKDADTANIGDTVNFTLTGTLPDNYDSYSTYKYIFHDTLSKGLTLNKDSIKVYKNTVDENNVIESTHYTIEPTGDTTLNDGCTFEVKFTDLKQAVSKKADADNIIVTYSATLNENAEIGTTGNTNKVKLEYSNDPNKDGTGTTTEKEVFVYTFQLNVDKVDDKDKTETDGNTVYNKGLNGAEFELYSDEECTKKIKLVKVSDGAYRVAKTDETDVGTITTATVDGKDGTLSIAGLKDGTYYLKETKAPDGYNLPTGKDAIKKITLGATTSLNGSLNQETCENVTVIKAGNAATGTATVTITNNAGSQLPSTGGMGTTLFYVIGGALMAGAAIVLVIKKKRSSAE